MEEVNAGCLMVVISLLPLRRKSGTKSEITFFFAGAVSSV